MWGKRWLGPFIKQIAPNLVRLWCTEGCGCIQPNRQAEISPLLATLRGLGEVIGYDVIFTGGIYHRSACKLLHVHFLALCQCTSIVLDMNDHTDFPFRDPFSDPSVPSIRSSVSGPISIRRSDSTLDQISTTKPPCGISPLQPKYVFKSYLLSGK